ncbi:uncharacterized protein LOC110866623 [Helianthus annuus]|uniref:uncharacterized protein LOC110866623 n=1 Tax=Helianthus annuus TaxID=4232 RepID=UPI001652EA92|nr:uncharacterized protein LOC110866623 [Helianthus annuus]
MSERNDDDPVQTSTEQMKEIIAEEVGKAIEGSLSGFIDKIQNMVLSLVEERVKRLEDSVNLIKEKSGERKGCSYKEFMACKPPIYNGEVDPIICQRWLSDVDGVFERTHCDVSDYVAYGTGQLRGQAKDWWDNKKKEIGAEAARVMTWDEFKVPFLKHHSPKAVINKIKEEFIQLRQKGETIDKITAMDVNLSPIKKARTTETVKETDAKGGTPSCKVCGEGHKGECRFKDKPCPICRKTGHTAALCPGKVSVCYKCYQPGYKKSECPELDGKRNEKDVQMEAQKARARSFQLTATEVKIEPDVVSGMFLVNLILTQILFDSGAKYY